MGASLRLGAETARWKANTSKDPADVAAADLAEKTLAEHVVKQANADRV
jgi:hypothetical protein